MANAFEKSAAAETFVSADGQSLRLKSDNSKYGAQLVTDSIAVKQNYEYAMRLPVIVEEGRMTINVLSGDAKRRYRFGDY